MKIMTCNTDETAKTSFIFNVGSTVGVSTFNRTFEKCSIEIEIISQEFTPLSPGEPDLNKSDLFTTNDRIKNMYYDSLCDKI